MKGVIGCTMTADTNTGVIMDFEWKLGLLLRNNYLDFLLQVMGLQHSLHLF